jgi:hypothetical protein
LDQDERILSLTSQLRIMSEAARGISSTSTEQKTSLRSKFELEGLVSKVEDTFINISELPNLTQDEHNQLTRLSLSKILNNMRTKLKEEQNRVQSVSASN